ncbi:unnamed protein product [Symbiodinium microadriaticum]|nr:unnamed protein product [Symbiodinium microadriaticum]
MVNLRPCRMQAKARLRLLRRSCRRAQLGWSSWSSECAGKHTMVRSTWRSSRSTGRLGGPTPVAGIPQAFVGPPHSTGELRVGGFLNAVAKLREDVALVAVSAGLIPTPGESLKVYDLSPPLPSPKKAKSCFLHTRGCRALALWPRPGDAELAASISKDTLAVSRVRPDGGLQEGPPAFSASNPHNMQEVMALSWQEEGCLCSGGTAGTVKAWDLNSTAGALWTCCVCPGTWIRHLTRCSASGCLVVGHSEGLCWVDGRTGQPVGHIAGLGQAYASASITEDLRIVAFGRQLMALDRRAAAPAPESAATLDAAALSLSLQSCGKSMQSMLVGSKDGAARLYAVHA